MVAFTALHLPTATDIHRTTTDATHIVATKMHGNRALSPFAATLPPSATTSPSPLYKGFLRWWWQSGSKNREKIFYARVASCFVK